MAATWSMNLSLKKDEGQFIDVCEKIGCFQVKVQCEYDEGANAIFHIASSKNGQRVVKRTVSTSGENGEQLMIVWPKKSAPILVYENDDYAPEKEMVYHLKIT